MSHRIRVTTSGGVTGNRSAIMQGEPFPSLVAAQQECDRLAAERASTIAEADAYYRETGRVQRNPHAQITYTPIAS